MNFINHTPENRIPDFAFKTIDFNESPSHPESTETVNPTFEKMVEASLQEDNITESVETKNSEKQSQVNDVQERKVENLTEKSLNNKKISKLLALLEKLIQKKELTEPEEAFLVQNLNFLKQQFGELTQKNNGQPQVLLNNPILAKLLQVEIKLPPEMMEQVKQITELLKNFKDSQMVQTDKGRNDLHALEKSPNLTKTHPEKLSDLTKGTPDRQVKVNDVYIQSRDRFNVLKGNKGNKVVAEIAEQVNKPTQGRQELKVNPTHQKNPTHITNNNPGTMAQVQKNLVINAFSGRNTGNGSMDFSSQGFSQQSHSPIDKTAMFSQNNLPHSLNFKSLVQYLHGKIHNGFVSGKQVMLVKLQPENLGEVQIFLKKESENSLHLKLKVESPELKELLEKNSQDIRVGLNKDNLDLLSFDVDVHRHSDFEQSQQKNPGEKFNEFSSTGENQNSTEENSKTVDLRITHNVLNIRI